ncbi:MAG: response regulator [Longimicrobiales bacterium]|nr:response regulator [Longimicrobiales bacterium]
MAYILVVDDDPSDRTLLSEILGSAGHKVVSVADGQQALDVLERRSDIRAVVSDLRMPVLNGLRLIRTLRDGGDTIPIIAISGANADQLLLAEDYGANAILFKPLRREKVLEAVDRILTETRSDWSDAWIHPEFGSVGEY